MNAIEAILADPDLLAASAFIATMLVVSALALLLLPGMDGNRRRLQRRIARITRLQSRATEVDADVVLETVRRRDAANRFRGINRSLRALIPNSNLLRLRLERAGWGLSVVEYLGIGLGLGLVVGGVLQFVYAAPPLIGVSLAVTAAFGVPHFVLARAIDKRLRRFTLLLPEAIDLIVRGIRSGLPVTEAINVIGQEMDEPIGSEFRQVGAQLAIGVELEEALWSAARRLDVQEFKFFVISLSIQRETGGNLSEVLENLSSLIRRREQMRLKIKAMSSEARASAMIVGALPFIMTAMIYLVNADYIMTLFIDPRGWLITGAGLTFLSAGVLIMAKMIRFEI